MMMCHERGDVQASGPRSRWRVRRCQAAQPHAFQQTRDLITRLRRAAVNTYDIGENASGARQSERTIK